MSERIIRISSSQQIGVDAEGQGHVVLRDERGRVRLEFVTKELFLDAINTLSMAGMEFCAAEERAFAAAVFVRQHLTPDDECGGGDYPPLARV
jgi:hypothetical protein